MDHPVERKEIIHRLVTKRVTVRASFPTEPSLAFAATLAALTVSAAIVWAIWGEPLAPVDAGTSMRSAS